MRISTCDEPIDRGLPARMPLWWRLKIAALPECYQEAGEHDQGTAA
jgi:hypothetical protein